MIDIKLLRENLDAVREGVAKKKFKCDLDAILKLDGERREHIQKAEEARANQRVANQEMASMKKGTSEFLEKVAAMKVISSEVKELESKAKEIEERWQGLIMTIPNIPHESVPVGKNEQDNQVFRTWGESEGSFPHAKPHYDIEGFSSWIDFERGSKVTGAGFPFYLGDCARLVRSLITFFLEEARNQGYTEVAAPLFVNAASATATGQLPDKEGQMYHIQDQDFYAIPTAEVPITNFFRDEIFDKKALPVKRVGYTPCFRREAGSWGKDVRGLNRLHQFDKVELVQWVDPAKSYEALEGLLSDAETLLQKLEIPYRVLLICSGDIGFPHAKQYDLEVWSAGQKRWLEVSSCSNFTDFQARRANIRFRPEDGKPAAVHTLNGSALAIPRVLAAILENNLDADGRVRVPEVLRPWYGGEFLQVPDLEHATN